MGKGVSTMQKNSTYDLLCSLIGISPTLAMMREFGGTEIILVRGDSRSTSAKRAQIAEIIGEHEYEMLLKHYGVYARVSIPMGKDLIRAWEISEAIRLLDDGLTANEVAVRLKHSYRWVQRVSKTIPDRHVAQAGKAVAQGELF